MAEKSSSTSALDEKFSRAANYLQSLVPKLDSTQLLEFYGLYKQATCGICERPSPSWYQTQEKHKWKAWKALGDMSRDDAMKKYISTITQLQPDWEEDVNVTSGSWIAVSSLLNTESELCDTEKTLLDWVKESNNFKVRDLLSNIAVNIADADDSGMLPIHWAADRGHVPTIRCLVEFGADVNAQDQDGQTALHYAASCGHCEAVEYLLSVGAESLKDNEGFTPKDIADQSTIAMFN